MLSWIDISKSALRHNLQNFAEVAGPAKVALVLKSNAYGHGLEQTYRAIQEESPEWLCTNYIFEATALRKLGYKGRLLVVGPAVSEQFSQALDCDAELTLGNQDVIDSWITHEPKVKIHVKIDTGMGRQGFLPTEAETIATKLLPFKHHVAGLSMHFANVEDVTKHDYAEKQIREFETAHAVFAAKGFQLLKHAASSASTLLLPKSRWDLVRVGISFYGFWPSQATRISFLQEYGKILDLRPALSWRTSVTSVKAVSAGQFVGYGCTYRAVRDMQVAVLPVGYFEGYPRLASNQGSYVLIHGVRCPIIGRLCMNMMMVDVSHLNSIRSGDVATFIGTDGEESISAEEVAEWAHTIHYELVSRLHPEIPRRLV